MNYTFDWGGFYTPPKRLFKALLAYFDQYSLSGAIEVASAFLLNTVVIEEIQSFKHVPTGIAAANVSYDIATLASQTGFGCTTLADPARNLFCRSLDWCIPCNLKNDMRSATVGRLEMPTIPGVVGAHTLLGDHMCLALNQAYLNRKLSGYDIATMVHAAACTGKYIPTLVWVRELGMVIDSLIERGMDVDLEAVVESLPRPLAPGIVTGLMSAEGGYKTAFKIEVFDPWKSKWFNLKTSHDRPLVSTNHYEMSDNPEWLDEFDTWQRHSAVRSEGRSAFSRGPVRCASVQSGYWTRSVA